MQENYRRVEAQLNEPNPPDQEPPTEQPKDVVLI